MQKEIADESNVRPEMHVSAMMAEVQGLPNLAGPAAGQPLKSAESSILVITQTASRIAVAIRRNILTPRH